MKVDTILGSRAHIIQLQMKAETDEEKQRETLEFFYISFG